MAVETPEQREGRRAISYKALTSGLDEKLMRGGADRALEHLEDAYDRARNPDALSWPLPAVTAYRLAYLLMRRARSLDDLARVDALLIEAGEGDTVDPLQHALHLVVIERLRDATNGPREKAYLKKQSLAAFKRLKKSSREVSVDASAGPMQDDLFNLVELSGFLVGDDGYDALEGRAHLTTKFLPRSQPDAFVLFGNHGVDPDVRWARSVAEGEFKARIDERAVDLAFEWTDVPRIVLPKSLKIHDDILRTFPDFCVSRAPPAGLRNFDQNLARAREAIAKALPYIDGRKLEANKVIENEQRGRKGVYAFNPDLRVLGLFSLESYERWYERRRKNVSRM